MRNMLLKVAAVGLFATTSSAAIAQGLEWRVSESSGPVVIADGNQKRAGTRGTLLRPGQSVQAGPGGRAVLVHGRDFVTVSPNSRVTVPTAEKATGFVQLLQDWGNAIFRIEKKGVPHFGVNTPTMAAVVKGTTFSITVDRSGTSLQVTEGAVEVATLDGGARDLIRPGGLASIAAADPFRLDVRGDATRVIDSPARPQATAPASNGQQSAQAEAPALPLAPTVEADTKIEVATIAQPISAKPADLSALTNGLVAGATAATQVASVSAGVRALAEAVPGAPTAPAPTPAAPAGNEGGKGTPASDQAGDSSSGKGGAAGNAAQPGSGNSSTDASGSGGGAQGNGNASSPNDAGGGTPGKPDDAGTPAKGDDAGGKPNKADDDKPAGGAESGGKPGNAGDVGGKLGDDNGAGDKGGPGGEPDGKPGKDVDESGGSDLDGKPDSGGDAGGKPGDDNRTASRTR